ncbi:hypothetical protein [Tatumella sp. UBA2305]|uniref:hypothetical protein n=1 Tax=Tatumella sp. UBA2305 TaxID=1947647 RepID=UPI0025EF5296|nr:hypothetical protein [Tatumella sp. UBA2305]
MLSSERKGARQTPAQALDNQLITRSTVFPLFKLWFQYRYRPETAYQLTILFLQGTLALRGSSEIIRAHNLYHPAITH